MAYRANPFLERMSERTTSDEEFVRLFSPKILERLSEEAFEGAVHVFRSPPGGGKTTLLRAFTPAALRAFWHAGKLSETNEAYQDLLARNLLTEREGPQLLGVFLSCASGYADLPPGAAVSQEGLFRALLDCRIVLRSLRSLVSLLGLASTEQLDRVTLKYDEVGRDLKSVPTSASARELLHWAEQRERGVYAELDSMTGSGGGQIPSHVRFEGVLWLQSVRFSLDGQPVAPKRLLMIDDLHKLRRSQRSLLTDELVVIRPQIPIWLAERSISLGDALLSQGAREGRDLREYSLDDIWGVAKYSHQFASFAQNILDRRLDIQTEISPAAFSQYLQADVRDEDVREEVARGIEIFRAAVDRHRSTTRYAEWIARAETLVLERHLASLQALYSTRILLKRDEAKRQTSLDLEPLSAEELEQRDSSQAQAAAEVFMHEELGIPYYFGIDRVCSMATGNVEELLSLAAVLYQGLLAKKVLRKGELRLSPREQEKLLVDAAKKKREFIPKSHTEGTRAQRLIDAVGSYCRERTFLPNAPIAPGVTGVRLSSSELQKLNTDNVEQRVVLRRVLAESVAENLFVLRASAATTSRQGGTVFYLNRTLCAHYGLPLQMGGWQDLQVEALVGWMERGRIPAKLSLAELD